MNKLEKSFINNSDKINTNNILNINNNKHFKQIGTLTPEERKAKIERYKQKKWRRTFNKKINYDCRKKVADKRDRLKGRFVKKIDENL